MSSLKKIRSRTVHEPPIANSCSPSKHRLGHPQGQKGSLQVALKLNTSNDFGTLLHRPHPLLSERKAARKQTLPIGEQDLSRPCRVLPRALECSCVLFASRCFPLSALVSACLFVLSPRTVGDHRQPAPWRLSYFSSPAAGAYPPAGTVTALAASGSSEVPILRSVLTDPTFTTSKRLCSSWHQHALQQIRSPVYDCHPPVPSGQFLG